MLGRFRGLNGANLTPGGDPHALELGSNREATIQGEPDEVAHFVGVGVVPDFGNHLRISGVLKIQILNKGANAQGVGWFLCVPVAPLGQVAEERWVSHWGGGGAAIASHRSPKGGFRWNQIQKSRIGVVVWWVQGAL